MVKQHALTYINNLCVLCVSVVQDFSQSIGQTRYQTSYN